MTVQELQDHLNQEHKKNPLSQYLREIVYGGNDGIVTTFAVVAGFSGANFADSELAGLSFAAVLLFGIANLAADGLSMGLGNFLSIRAQKDIYRQESLKERAEIRTKPEQELAETILILQKKGFSEENASSLAKIYMNNEDYWVQWMMQHELGITSEEGTNPTLTGLATFLSFIAFGSIPILPYALLGQSSAEQVFLVSVVSTLLALMGLGLLRWRVTGEKFLRSVGEVVVIGFVAAIAAFVAGRLFG